ncbi:MAG TPA: porin [Sphingomonadaceae bacterium]|nr:porin [Sphingomonadaceae bacterium]
MRSNLQSSAFPLLSAVAIGALASPSAALAQDGGEWSLQPRGRLQVDAGWVDADPAVEAAADAVTPGGLDADVEVRRAYLGVDGKMPGNLGFRVEGEFAGPFDGATVTWTDVYLYWDATKNLRVTLGNQKPFWGLEELTSDLFPSFAERAAINTAFGHERRVGVSAAYKTGDVLLQGGAFTDDLDSLLGNNDRGHSFDGRVVYAPELGGGRLHLGASAHLRGFDDAASVRYSVRPFIHNADTKFANTGSISGTTGEASYGLEAAYLKGPFHVMAETRWQHVDRTGPLAEPTFFGGYVEAGYFLTKGDTRGYKGGAFDRVKPANPLGKGGIGAVQVNVRYDYLDLVDAGITGGIQNGYEISLIWTPTSHTRFIANYGRMEYDQAAIAVGTDRSYGVDAFGIRGQFDF